MFCFVHFVRTPRSHRKSYCPLCRTVYPHEKYSRGKHTLRLTRAERPRLCKWRYSTVLRSLDTSHAFSKESGTCTDDTVKVVATKYTKYNTLNILNNILNMMRSETY